MNTETRHADSDGYSVDILVVNLEPGGLSTSHSDKVRLLMDFGEHGREFITSEVGLRFLRAVTDSKRFEAAAGSARRAARLRRILDACAFKILPMENTKGRDLVEGGKLCERKNGRGVDTNRNWDVDWGVKEKDYDPAEEYPGKAPHSEPEVQIILGEAKAFKPHVWLNVHSGMFALFTPYDHKAQVPDGPEAAASLRMMSRINELSCNGRCVVGSGGKSVGYLAHGTATDYMYSVLKVPMSFTWEIFGDTSASFEDCFKMFNPITKQGFEDTVDTWVAALFQLIELLPTHPASAPLLRAALAEPPPGSQEGRQQAASPGPHGALRHGRNAEAHRERQEQQQQQGEGGAGSKEDGGGGSSSSGEGGLEEGGAQKEEQQQQQEQQTREWLKQHQERKQQQLQQQQQQQQPGLGASLLRPSSGTPLVRRGTSHMYVLLVVLAVAVCGLAFGRLLKARARLSDGDRSQ